LSLLLQISLIWTQDGLPLGHEPSDVSGANIDEIVQLADVEVLVSHDALVHHVDPESEGQTSVKQAHLE